MNVTVSDFLLQRLGEWGITRIYGYPGDGINGIIGALNRAGDDFDFIQVRHEEMAAFMACGHAKFTGQVGVCLATSGSGAIHLHNGLYDAKLDHQPVVAIVGQQARAALGGALSSDRPTVLDTDPDVPPLPPHVSFKQARQFAESLLKRDSDTMGVIRASLEEIFA